MDHLSYTQLLRPVGQLFESLRIESFAITIDQDGVVIRDETRVASDSFSRPCGRFPD
jgi:hypothetical protein